MRTEHSPALSSTATYARRKGSIEEMMGEWGGKEGEKDLSEIERKSKHLENRMIFNPFS